MKNTYLLIGMLSISLLINAQGSIGIGGGSRFVDDLEFNWTIGSIIGQESFSSEDLMITQGILGVVHQSISGGGETSIDKLYVGSLNVYPNPARDYVNISFENAVENVELMLYTPQGQLLFSKQLSESSYQLNLSSYSEGLYLLRFNVDQQYYSTPLLVK